MARPVIRENDTADYPWHAWLASDFGERHLPIIPPLNPEDQKYDVWLAYVQFSVLSSLFLRLHTNSYPP